MYEVLIDKVIGDDWWRSLTGEATEITAEDVRKWFANFPQNETEVRIIINSPGGDWLNGTTIFNIIRDFARSNPKVKITTYIQGLAGSMASCIALAANAVNPEQNKVIVEDNSTYMIHRSSCYCHGNRNDIHDALNWLEAVDKAMVHIYTRKTGMSDKEIEEMVDAETWLFGKEILEKGFADSILEDSNHDKNDFPSTRATNLANAKACYEKSQMMIQELYAKKGKDIPAQNYKAAALALEIPGGSPSDKEAEKVTASVNTKGVTKMTIEELKKNSPDVYAQAVSDGEKAGVEKEQARVSRLLAMGKRSGAMDYALSCIESKANPCDENVIDAFMDKGAKAQALAAQNGDGDIPNLNPPKNDNKADTEVLIKVFEKAFNDGGCYDD